MFNIKPFYMEEVRGGFLMSRKQFLNFLIMFGATDKIVLENFGLSGSEKISEASLQIWTDMVNYSWSRLKQMKWIKNMINVNTALFRKAFCGLYIT